jgi:hypothetical protein
MHRPAGLSVVQWALDGVSLKTIILATIAIVGSHATMAGKVSVLDKRVDIHDHVLEAQSETLKEKLDRETYYADQHQQAQDIHDMKISLNTIQQALMEGHR